MHTHVRNNIGAGHVMAVRGDPEDSDSDYSERFDLRTVRGGRVLTFNVKHKSVIGTVSSSRNNNQTDTSGRLSVGFHRNNPDDDASPPLPQKASTSSLLSVPTTQGKNSASSASISQYQLGVHVERAPGMFFRTRVITVSPRLILINQIKSPMSRLFQKVLVRQYQGRDSTKADSSDRSTAGASGYVSRSGCDNDVGRRGGNGLGRSAHEKGTVCLLPNQSTSYNWPLAKRGHYLQLRPIEEVEEISLQGDGILPFRRKKSSRKAVSGGSSSSNICASEWDSGESGKSKCKCDREKKRSEKEREWVRERRKKKEKEKITIQWVWSGHFELGDCGTQVIMLHGKKIHKHTGACVGWKRRYLSVTVKSYSASLFVIFKNVNDVNTESKPFEDALPSSSSSSTLLVCERSDKDGRGDGRLASGGMTTQECGKNAHNDLTRNADRRDLAQECREDEGDDEKLDAERDKDRDDRKGEGKDGEEEENILIPDFIIENHTTFEIQCHQKKANVPVAETIGAQAWTPFGWSCPLPQENRRLMIAINNQYICDQGFVIDTVHEFPAFELSFPARLKAHTPKDIIADYLPVQKPNSALAIIKRLVTSSPSSKPAPMSKSRSRSPFRGSRSMPPSPPPSVAQSSLSNMSEGLNGGGRECEVVGELEYVNAVFNVEVVSKGPTRCVRIYMNQLSSSAFSSSSSSSSDAKRPTCTGGVEADPSHSPSSEFSGPEGRAGGSNTHANTQEGSGARPARKRYSNQFSVIASGGSKKRNAVTSQGVKHSLSTRLNTLSFDVCLDSIGVSFISESRALRQYSITATSEGVGRRSAGDGDAITTDNESNGARGCDVESKHGDRNDGSGDDIGNNRGKGEMGREMNKQQQAGQKKGWLGNKVRAGFNNLRQAELRRRGELSARGWATGPSPYRTYDAKHINKNPRRLRLRAAGERNLNERSDQSHSNSRSNGGVVESTANDYVIGGGSSSDAGEESTKKQSDGESNTVLGHDPTNLSDVFENYSVPEELAFLYIGKIKADLSVTEEKDEKQTLIFSIDHLQVRMLVCSSTRDQIKDNVNAQAYTETHTYIHAYIFTYLHVYASSHVHIGALNHSLIYVFFNILIYACSKVDNQLHDSHFSVVLAPMGDQTDYDENHSDADKHRDPQFYFMAVRSTGMLYRADVNVLRFGRMCFCV